jgi:2-dehydropantoate 2-reductase
VRHRRYAIIGAGALGGFYGARLQGAGCDVHFLLHSDYEHVRQHGLVIESKDGNFTLPSVHAYRDVHDMPPCDIVIVALKATQNHLLPALLPSTGVVMLMQNGLGGEELVAGIVGAERVLCGLSFICSNKVGPGHIRHLDYGLVSLGEVATRGISDRMRGIADDLQRAGIPVQLLDDFRVARWNKLVWNIPYNGLSVILNATTTELMTNPDTRQLCEQIMREVVADAHACGVPVEDEIVAKMLDHTEKMTPYRTSMKIDFDEQRPMEVEAIFGNPLRAAQAAGAMSPLIETLYRQLKFLDARRCSSRRPGGNP